ncbi:hypothetical protein L332_11795 [Agrococcus pavilionensis RW1]|uniref:Uncharacterized protein n=1 Tax=Agrococcus pavilionensis RW1 TaxID=1330458 RepID=U1LD31_9MICO|nr:hypothetical protein L332_11795 [Agrococcus pavilionensis RW1]
MLVYGSCVARDTVDFAATGTVALQGYIARQSLISAGSDASLHLPGALEINSKFQERMIRADFRGNLYERLGAAAGEVDVLLWDLADERHGVYRFDDGTIVTRSIDNIRMPELEDRFAVAERIEFGTDEHFTLWSERAAAFKTRLGELSLFERTVVLEVPWAVLTTEGKPSPWSMGVRAKDANKRYARYYELLRRLGFRMVRIDEGVVLADPAHKWGLAPFHYSPAVYREVLRQLREDLGFLGFRTQAE